MHLPERGTEASVDHVLVLGIEHQPAADPHFLPVVIGISVAAHVSCPRFQTSRGPACVLAANAGRGFHNKWQHPLPRRREPSAACASPRPRPASRDNWSIRRRVRRYEFKSIAVARAAAQDSCKATFGAFSHILIPQVQGGLSRRRISEPP